ncbi:hypothetical protein MKW94_008741 [Papaver nudicaule]|uniref:Uncharacterized protein n=1 Tax=Papaver nudicaule TaxID=74823 RepID=A0AA41VVM8_PAPNU|nr:hypothetical protein [Papaver nudicaule]
MSSANHASRVSTTMVRPESYKDEQNDNYQRIDLNPWDLLFLGVTYMQYGFIFTKSKEEVTHDESVSHKISHLKTSLSHALDLFFPLAGRLGIEKHEDDDTISVYINCNSEGAEIIHATSEISHHRSTLFSLNGVLNYEGGSQPLLSIQVTELLDGIFIGCSANHSVCDGISLWEFINAWSDICRSSDDHTPYCPPVFERWFMNDTDRPLRFSYSFPDNLLAVKNPTGDAVVPPLHDCAEKCFRFTKTNIAKLKAAVNSETIPGTEGNLVISSLQCVLAHVWIAVIRARRSLNINYNENEETLLGLIMSNRTKLIPPLPKAFFGNSTTYERLTVKDGEVLNKGFGFLASLLNEAINSHSDEKIKSSVKWWIKKPFILSSVHVSESGKNLMARSSHRFNVYGNDFGWGRPIAVKRGRNGKSSGVTTVSPGPVEGGIDIEILLPVEVFKAMERDAEFMEAFSAEPLSSRAQEY